MKTSYKVIFTFLLLFTTYSNSFSQLSGIYTIGTGGDYTTINNAVSAAVTQGIIGPVVFNIISGVYDEHIVIDFIPGTSTVNTVTFKSQTGNPNDVKITYTVSDYNIIVINGVENLIIQDVTISNSINIFRKIQFINNCKNIKIINNIFINEPIAKQAGIDIDGDLFFGPFNLNNILIENNVFSFSSYNIEINSVFSISSNIRILNNTFNAYIIIEMDGCDSVLIEKNKRLSEEVGSFRLNNCKFFKVSKNIFPAKNGIFDLVLFESGDTLSQSIVSNNFIPQGYISIWSSFNILLIYNSIVTRWSFPAYANIFCNYSSDIYSSNNLFMNSVGGYSLNSNNSGLNSDYNDYYNVANSNLILYDNSNYDNVSVFYNATGLDQHSNSVPVTFVSPTNLHLTGSSIGDEQLAGIPTALVTDDIDGQPRNPFHPYKGADEVVDFPLPVELASFTSSVVRNNVNLKWTTSSEINNSGFDVERIDARRETQDVWKKVGFVKGSGSNSSLTNYEFTDKNLLPGKYNYRLKQIDLNGNFEYYDLSNEVVIGVPTEYKLSQNYPNPFNPKTIINFSLPAAHYTVVKIYSVNGKEVETLLNKVQEAGEYNVEFNASDFSSGIYFYSLNVDGNVIGTKENDFVKVKSSYFSAAHQPKLSN